MLKAFLKSIKDSPTVWAGTFLLTFLYGNAYVFMEWLFQVTKPSFMGELSFLGKVGILLLIASLTSCLALAAVFLFFLLQKSRLLHKFERLLFIVANAIPAAIASSLVLILVDNFTYTMFRYGIISTEGVWRVLYGLIFLIFFLFILGSTIKFAAKAEKKLLPKVSRLTFLVIIGFVLGSMIIPIALHKNKEPEIFGVKASHSGAELPNIILITADGLNADHMSVYGYPRDTTPFLTELAKTSLLSENHFSNAGKTTGSIASILTGKYATTTRLLFPPNILRGEDSYQHLPGILKKNGYYSVQMGNSQYIDALNVNLLDGFDNVNERYAMGEFQTKFLNTFLPGEASYFLFETSERIFSRVAHIFMIKKMQNAYLMVTTSESFEETDAKHLAELYDILDNMDQPTFVQIHWLGTHGPQYFPSQQVFSLGKDLKTQEKYDNDTYDDAILEFDQTLKSIYERLMSDERLSNTILIVSSDHGQGFTTVRRLPLLIHFPQEEVAQEVQNNTQNLDISPTLLDYLGIEKPLWMAGDSLLEGMEEQRPVYSFGIGDVEATNVIIADALKPPFYQFGYMTTVYCNRWYRLNLVDFSLGKGTVKSHTSDCSQSQKTDKEILQLMINHLKENDFDTATLETWAENNVR